MSPQWNSFNTNLHFGNEHPRPYVSRPMMLACRLCDKIFLSSQSLIEHYEAHQNEISQRTQNNQTTPYVSSLRESRERNLTNNPFQARLSLSSTLQQRHHPYFSNGFRMLQHDGASIAPSNPFLASFPNSISGRTVVGCCQSAIRQRLSSGQRVSPPQRVPFPNSLGQNQHDEHPLHIDEIMESNGIHATTCIPCT